MVASIFDPLSSLGWTRLGLGLVLVLDLLESTPAAPA